MDNFIEEKTYNAEAWLLVPDVKGFISVSYHTCTKEEIQKSLKEICNRLNAKGYEFSNFEETSMIKAHFDINRPSARILLEQMTPKITKKEEDK